MSARYLRRDGLNVRLVTSPELTLAELTGGPDAAAVIDLTMPGLDPRRIRRALRTPVIFLVAGSGGPRPRGLAVRGQRRWLARPFSPRQLVTMVRDVLAQAQTQAEAEAEAEAQAQPAQTPLRPAAPVPVPVGRNAGGWRLDNPNQVRGSRRSPRTADRDRVRGARGPRGPPRPGPVPPAVAGRGRPPRHGRPGRRRAHRPAQGQTRAGPEGPGDQDDPRRGLRPGSVIGGHSPTHPTVWNSRPIRKPIAAAPRPIRTIWIPFLRQSPTRAPPCSSREAPRPIVPRPRHPRRNRFQGGSSRGPEAAGLPSVAQQCRREETSEPRECARRDP